MLAQALQLGDVDFLDIREVRDVALGLGDALRADAAHAEDADLLRLGARLDASGRRRACGAPGAFCCAWLIAASRSCR